jgi:polysaccharide biosynthesis transport protein
MIEPDPKVWCVARSSLNDAVLMFNSLASSPYPISSMAPGSANDASYAGAAPVAAFHRQPADAVGLAEFVSILRRRIRTILVVMSLTIGLGIAYLLTTTPLFTAATAVFVDPRQRASFQIEGQGSGAGFDANLVDSQVRLIESDPVLNRVIEAEKLLDDPEFNRGGDDPARATMKNLKEAVKVKRPEKTYIVEIEVRSQEPQKSARIANSIANAYLKDTKDARQDTAQRESVWLETHLRDLQTRLIDAENRVEAFKAQNKIVGSEGKLVNELQLTELNRGLIDARRKSSEAKATLDQVVEMRSQGRLSDTTSEALRSPVIDRLRGQLTEILRLDANARSTLGPRHPASQEIREQLAETRRQITDELGRIEKSAESTYRVARINEIALEKQLDGLKNLSTTTNQTLVRMRELEREVEAQKAVFQKFLSDKEQIARLTVESSAGRIIVPAFPPQRKSHPKTILVLGLAGIGGSLLGVILALIGETLQRGKAAYGQAPMRAVRQADPSDQNSPSLGREYRAVSNLGADGFAAKVAQSRPPELVIAQLPALPQRGKLRWINKAEDGAQDAQSYSESQLHDLVQHQPDSAFARAITQLAQDLTPLLHHKMLPSLVLSSMKARADSSIITSNLAAAFAARGLNVLIVDAHPQQSSLARVFAKHNERVSVALKGAIVEAIEVPFHAQNRMRGGVFLLPFGARAEGSRHGAVEPDLILIDGPEIRSLTMKDPDLRAQVDGVLIVLPAELSPHHPDLQADARREFGPLLMGLVAQAA